MNLIEYIQNNIFNIIIFLINKGGKYKYFYIILNKKYIFFLKKYIYFLKKYIYFNINLFNINLFKTILLHY